MAFYQLTEDMKNGLYHFLISPPRDPLRADTLMVIRGAYDSEVTRLGSSQIDTPLFDRLASKVFASRKRDEW